MSRLPTDWPARRYTVLLRDRGWCYLCRQRGADEVDHIADDRDHSLGNLAAVHASPCMENQLAIQEKMP